MKTTLLTYLGLIICASGMHAQTLLKDIETLGGDGSSSPSNWCAVNDDIFIFQATNILETNYLYASDGTSGGTIGLGGYQVDTDIIQLGNHAFFGGCDISTNADSCSSLYISDGTVEGTTFFFDLDPGGVSLGIEDIVAGDNVFYFSGHTIDSGYELYRSDGTIAGTYQVMDIADGALSGYAGELAVIDDIAYFAGYTEEFGIEAWRSDGTVAGTYMITDLNEGTADAFPAGFTKSGGYIYFSGLGTNTGVEVRRTTGEPENIEVIGEQGGSTDSSNPREFVDSDGRLYYVAEGAGAAGFNLFVYDHVGDPFHIDLDGPDIFPRALMPFGDGEVIFNAVDDAGRELWRSDGTIEGTFRIIDLYPGELDGVFGTGTVGGSYYMCLDSLVFFAGSDGVNAMGEFVYELFVSDGTEAGTHLINDQVVGTGGSNPGSFFEFDGRLYYAATDATIGREPFYLNKGTTNAVHESTSGINISVRPYPNPLPQGTPLTLELQLESGTDIQVQLLDLTGRPVQNIQNLGHYQAGKCSIQFYPEHRASGFYLLEISTQGNRVSLPIIIE
ncbi:MAG: T9SS type A sorting domain-containing protein [Saprospiraceae bacterium]|nr:T9SS type A sorting domain-containing protein [Saprospiraceae bacterium]